MSGILRDAISNISMGKCTIRLFKQMGNHLYKTVTMGVLSFNSNMFDVCAYSK